MKIYARQINPAHQESPLFFDYFPDNTAVFGNRDFGEYMPDVVRRVREVLESGELDEEIETASLITITVGGNDLLDPLYVAMVDRYNELCGTDNIYETDPLRMVLNLSHVKTDGYYVADYLRNKANIEVESASESNVVCLVSIYNSVQEIRKLFHALLSLSKTVDAKRVVVDDVLEHSNPEDLDMKLTPEKAFNASGEFVTPEYSIDRVSKRIVYRMPDEVPIILPGEKIKQCHLMEISKIIAAKGAVKGLGPDSTLEVVTLSESFGL